MSSAHIWIFTPLVIAVILLLLRRYIKLSNLISIITAFILAALAWLLPIGQGFTLFGKNILIPGEFFVVGRKFVIDPQNLSLIGLVYLALAFWYGATLFFEIDELFYPLSLTIVAMDVSAISVKPFLYAALAFGIVGLLSIFLLDQSKYSVRQGSIRLLTYQIIGMAFLLLAGRELDLFNPREFDINEAALALVFISGGIIFLLGIFPFHSWIPMIAKNTNPYIAGFVFSTLPGFMSLYILNFILEFEWLREIALFFDLLRIGGIVMLLFGGIWAAFQDDLRQLMGYAVLIEIGRSLIALSTQIEPTRYYAFYIPRLIGFGVWTLALYMLCKRKGSCDLLCIQGLAIKFPLLSLTLLIAIFSIAGVPLLAEFPIILSLSDLFNESHSIITISLLVSSGGVLLAGLRILNTMVDFEKSDVNEEQGSKQLGLNILLLLGSFALLVMGIAPQWIYSMFERFLSL
ncbi:MAG TPA: hypothetical protein G4N95_02200 [Anaerolineae bacterium]|nr:hypothetical protein [Anaerolineae bacterium]